MPQKKETTDRAPHRTPPSRAPLFQYAFQYEMSLEAESRAASSTASTECVRRGPAGSHFPTLVQQIGSNCNLHLERCNKNIFAPVTFTKSITRVLAARSE